MFIEFHSNRTFDVGQAVNNEDCIELDEVP